MKYKPDRNTERIRKWLSSRTKRKDVKVVEWLKRRGYADAGIVHLLHGERLANDRKELIAEFRIK